MSISILPTSISSVHHLTIYVVIHSTTVSTYLSIWFSEPLVYLPYELWASWAHKFTDLEQVEDVVGGQHLCALACGRRAWFKFGEHCAGGRRHRWQTAASPEVWPTYLVGYLIELDKSPETRTVTYGRRSVPIRRCRIVCTLRNKNENDSWIQFLFQIAIERL